MSDCRKCVLLIGIATAGGLLYLLAPVLIPFLVAALLAYLGNPLVERLCTWRLPRLLATVVVFLLIYLLLPLLVLAFIPPLAAQAGALVAHLPDYVAWGQRTVLPWLREYFHLDLQALNVSSLQQVLSTHLTQAGGLAARLLASITSSGLALIEWLIGLVVTPVVTFYLLRDWDGLIGHIHALLPRRLEPTITRLARESDQVLGGFLRGQLLVMLSLGLIYSLGLWIAGLDLALLVGMLAGLLSFVPYLGFITGLVTASLAALMQYQDFMHLIPVLIVFSIGQMAESFVLTPHLVGERIGLHPVAVIFAVLAGGQLFGFLGVLLALPVASVVKVLLRHARERYINSRWYEDAE